MQEILTAILLSPLKSFLYNFLQYFLEIAPEIYPGSLNDTFPSFRFPPILVHGFLQNILRKFLSRRLQIKLFYEYYSGVFVIGSSKYFPINLLENFFKTSFIDVFFIRIRTFQRKSSPLSAFIQENQTFPLEILQGISLENLPKTLSIILPNIPPEFLPGII